LRKPLRLGTRDGANRTEAGIARRGLQLGQPFLGGCARQARRLLLQDTVSHLLAHLLQGLYSLRPVLDHPRRRQRIGADFEGLSIAL